MINHIVKFSSLSLFMVVSFLSAGDKNIIRVYGGGKRSVEQKAHSVSCPCRACAPHFKLLKCFVYDQIALSGQESKFKKLFPKIMINQFDAYVGEKKEYAIMPYMPLPNLCEQKAQQAIAHAHIIFYKLYYNVHLSVSDQKKFDDVDKEDVSYLVKECLKLHEQYNYKKAFNELPGLVFKKEAQNHLTLLLNAKPCQ